MNTIVESRGAVESHSALHDASNQGAPLLQVDGLVRHYAMPRESLFKPAPVVRALNGVDLNVAAGQSMGIVGESGSGKSTLARIGLRLLAPTSGRVLLRGRDITTLPERSVRPLRKDMAMVFQDPYGSLNPRHTVGRILGGVLRNHGLPRDRQVLEALVEQVGLSPVHLERYPHQFSGGQRQRIGIARALATEPGILLADEPVSALDVSVRAQVLNLLGDLKERRGLGLLLVSHDLGVVRTIADRVAVMSGGRVVEEGPVAQVYEDPQHPYTRTLLAAIPHSDPRRGRRQATRRPPA